MRTHDLSHEHVHSPLCHDADVKNVAAIGAYVPAPTTAAATYAQIIHAAAAPAAPTTPVAHEATQDSELDGRYVIGENECPKCGKSTTLRAWGANELDPDAYWIWYCCFSVCNDCDEQHAYLDSEQCDECSNCPASCSCPECSDCYEKGTCGNCENCEKHCSCQECSYCDKMVESVCENCNRCEYHCECMSCSYCGDKSEDICHECDHCENHCHCSYCNSCDCTTQSSDWCNNCDRCNECCICEYDPDDPDAHHSHSSHSHSSSHSSNQGRQGHTTVTPWEGRGETVVMEARPVDHDLWMTVDPVQSMAEFYLLSYMTRPTQRNTDYEVTQNVIVDLAEAERAALVAKLDPIFVHYLDMAIGGELRHHTSIRMSPGSSMSGNRMTAWGQWPSIREQVGVKVLLDAAFLFREFAAGTSYGGKPWAVAAEILHARLTGKLPPWAFVDRMFTMEHNTGSMFNKVSWGNFSRLEVDSVSVCKIVGIAHDAVDTNLRFLQALSGDKVNGIFRQWWAARNRARITYNERPLIFPRWMEDVLNPNTSYPAFGMKCVNAQGYPIETSYYFKSV